MVAYDYLMGWCSSNNSFIFRLRYLAVTFLLIFVSLVYLQQQHQVKISVGGRLLLPPELMVPREITPEDSPAAATSEQQQQPMLGTSSSSYCSLAADLRGAHQKVIGYSIYGDFSRDYVYRKYLKPFTETLRSIPIRYPGWIVRIYHNLTSDDVTSWRMLNQILDLAISRDQYIDLCNATQIIEERQLGDIFAMTWRWLPLLDDMVDVFMSRDTDSPVFPRESDAVAEWLASNQTFHIMRDHPAHCRFIMGGAWGVKISRQRSEIAAIAEKMLKQNHLHKYDYDQQLLDRFYQPMAKKSMVAHDSYCCEIIKSNSSRPFPTARENGVFVGWREIGQPNEWLKFPCPEKCRPPNSRLLNGSDWSYC